MKSLLLSFLTIVIYLISSTYSMASNHPVFCNFIGVNAGYEYVFDVNDVKNDPKGCEVFVYSVYYFDTDPAINIENEAAIRALVGINKTVYISICYYKNDGDWSELFNPPENREVFNGKIDALVSFLTDHKISGVIMQSLQLYKPNSTATAQNIAKLASELKKRMNNNLKVGMYVIGYDYQQFSNNTAFSYDVTNSAIDYYFIDVTVSNYCNQNTKNSSVNPIQNNSSFLLTLKDQSDAVSKSTMDKSKRVVILQVNAIKLEVLHPPEYDGDVEFGSYSMLCSFTENKEIVQWCTDYTSTLYQQGKFATQYYSGLMLTFLEGDDQHGNCHCGPFIVSNTIILGWKSETEPTCKRINELMKIK